MLHVPKKANVGGGGQERTGGSVVSFEGNAFFHPYSFSFSHSLSLSLSHYYCSKTNHPKLCGTKPPFYSAHMFWSSGIQREHSGNGWTLQCLGPQLGLLDIWGLEYLKACSLPRLATDTGCQLEHRHMASPCGVCMGSFGLPRSMVAGFQEEVPQRATQKHMALLWFCLKSYIV